MPDLIVAEALRADNPLGVMAALGVMQISSRVNALAGLRLGWAKTGASYCALFSTVQTVSKEQFSAALIEDLKTVASRSELTWTGAIKTVHQQTFRENMEKGDDRVRRWFAAFGTEFAVDDEEVLDPTPFDMSVARQQFLGDALKLGKSLLQTIGRKGIDTAAAYQEALFGPWRYVDDQHSLGWDPSTLKMGAFTSKAPTTMANTGVRAAVWLAFESLPFFPCVFEGSLATRSWVRRRRERELRWPVWDAQLAIDEISTLLGWRLLTDEQPDPVEMELRGVQAIFGSVKFKPNKYLVSFRPAKLIASQ